MRYYKNSTFYFSGPSSFMVTYFMTKENFFIENILLVSMAKVMQ